MLSVNTAQNSKPRVCLESQAFNQETIVLVLSLVAFKSVYSARVFLPVDCLECPATPDSRYRLSIFYRHTQKVRPSRSSRRPAQAYEDKDFLCATLKSLFPHMDDTVSFITNILMSLTTLPSCGRPAMSLVAFLAESKFLTEDGKRQEITTNVSMSTFISLLQLSPILFCTVILSSTTPKFSTT